MLGSSQGSLHPGHSSRFPRRVSQKPSLNCTEVDASWACRERGNPGFRATFGDSGADDSGAGPAVSAARPGRGRTARVHSVGFADGEVSVRYTCARSAPAAARTARRQWIEQAGHTPAQTPMWPSRDAWLTELSAWLATDDGLAECARVHLRPERALQVAMVLAAHADHATGRNCAVTNATVAQGAACSQRTVTTARDILRVSGLGVEAHRGSGSASTPGFGRRPSVWHLISRRPADACAAGHAVCDLPPSRSDRRLSLERSHSPNARPRASRSPSSPTRHSPSRRSLRAPRPLAVQRLADELVGNRYGRAPLCHGLGRGHIGAICDALMTAGIDPAVWSASQLTEALNTQMRSTGWSWPDRIERPAAFLTSRLRALPARPCAAGRGGGTAASPNKNVRVTMQVRDAEPNPTQAHTQRWYADVVAATTPAQRQRLLQAHETKFGPIVDPIVALANAGRRASRLFPQQPLTDSLIRWAQDVLGGQPRVVAAKPLPAATSLSTELLIDLAIGKCECIVCAAPHAVARPQLPLSSMVCEHCWPVIAAELDDPNSDTPEETWTA